MIAVVGGDFGSRNGSIIFHSVWYHSSYVCLETIDLMIDPMFQLVLGLLVSLLPLTLSLESLLRI